MTTHTLPDLVVLSHLRWTWVWQRPQQLVSRFAARRTEAGSRTWFVEEPLASNVKRPTIRHESVDGITRVWLEVPRATAGERSLGFDAREALGYGARLKQFLFEEIGISAPDVLVYTPLALDLARELSPECLAYDVMDDLSSFKFAAPGMQLAQRRLLVAADVVFAGGRSLHESVERKGNRECHLFPSGVETSHYAKSRTLRARQKSKGHRVAGYVGVIDERIDLPLLADLSRALPHWILQIVGPTAKIQESALPKAPNIKYSGMAAYAELPQVMSEFDVALMPFALNEATRSISPTKTLEYLAAGLPVVSTRVADVVSDYSGLVHFADTAEEFAAACHAVLNQSIEERDARLLPIQLKQDWDSIAAAMAELFEGARPHAHISAGPLGAVIGSEPLRASSLSMELERAHQQAAGAALAGLQDPALGEHRLSGQAVLRLADAAVSSATPYLRAPLLARVSAAMLLHPVAGDAEGKCVTCSTPAPCPTAIALTW